MRPSTALYLLGLLLALAGLLLSVRGVRSERTSGESREISFACWGAAEEIAELRQQVVDPINRGNHGWKIHLIAIPSDYHTKLATMMAGGVAPDLFYLSQEYVPAFAAQGALLDLTALVADDDAPVVDLASYYTSVLERYRHQGRLHGLPWIAQPVILYCNEALFRAAGVPLPDRSWDWAHFVAAGRKLTRDTDGDGTPDQWGFVLSGWPPCQIWIWQNGSDLIDPATGRVNLDDPRVLQALDFYGGLIHRDRIAPPLSVVSERGLSDLFRAGKVAMFMGGAADDLDRLSGLKVVDAELPAGPTGIRATFAWTAGLHISRGTPDPARAYQAWKLLLDGIQHWKVPAPRRELVARLGQIDPRKAPAADVIRASMEYMRTPAILDRQVQWDTLFAEDFLDELLREGTPAARLARRTRGVLENWP